MLLGTRKWRKWNGSVSFRFRSFTAIESFFFHATSKISGMVAACFLHFDSRHGSSEEAFFVGTGQVKRFTWYFGIFGSLLMLPTVAFPV